MNNPIQNEGDMKAPEYEKSFASIEGAETKEGKSMSTNDPDMMLSMTVLLIACLALAVLAHVFI
jgi:hypothetical protein